MSVGSPFFSIIIPTYKRPQALQDCIEALSRLEYPRHRFEIIIVDDGGGIPLMPLLTPFVNKMVIKVVSQPNAGPAAARNFGAMHASGDFLAFTDDDCEPDRHWLEALSAGLASTPDGLVGGRTVNALTSNPYAQASQTIIDVVYAHYNSPPRKVEFFASNNIAVSAKTFESVSGFDPGFRTSEDRDLCDRLRSKGCPLRYVPDAVIFHAHTLTFRSYWEQHSGYGRGAWLYHAARSQRGSGKFKPDWHFYRALVSAPFHRTSPWSATRDLLLILVAQMANAVGCARQGIGTLLTPVNGPRSMDSKER
jgi:GT2 family glycosyltransferase